MDSVIENYLEIDEPLEFDESVESFEYREHWPDGGENNLNGQGREIRININDLDLFTFPAESYLQVEGILWDSTNDANYANMANISLVNNGVMFMFNAIRYQINNNEIENVVNPGQATTMKGLLTYSNDFECGEGLNMCWQKETEDGGIGGINYTDIATAINIAGIAKAVQGATVNNVRDAIRAVFPAGNRIRTVSDGASAIVGATTQTVFNAISGITPSVNTGYITRHKYILQRPNPPGSFSFAIPLSHIFGFCDDYKKIIYGVKHTLTLTRSHDVDAIMRTANVAGCEIRLNKVSWFVPHVIPSTVQKVALYKKIEEKITIPVGFRSLQCDSCDVAGIVDLSWRISVKSGTEKPRWLIIGFQTNRSNNHGNSPAVFDHVNLQNIYATINNNRFPITDLDLNFTSGRHTSRAYKMLLEFKRAFYNQSEKSTSNGITLIEFHNIYPLFILDMRKQSERIRDSVQDIVIKAKFGQAVPANTIAYALLISDRQFKLQSDGRKFDVVY